MRAAGCGRATSTPRSPPARRTRTEAWSCASPPPTPRSWTSCARPWPPAARPPDRLAQAGGGDAEGLNGRLVRVAGGGLAAVELEARDRVPRRLVESAGGLAGVVVAAVQGALERLDRVRRNVDVAVLRRARGGHRAQAGRLVE